jgi:hypothetical protein
MATREGNGLSRQKVSLLEASRLVQVEECVARDEGRLLLPLTRLMREEGQSARLQKRPKSTTTPNDLRDRYAPGLA